VGKLAKLGRNLILVSMFFLSFVNVGSASATKYHVDPNLIVLGDLGGVIGTEFTVNVVVSDAFDLYGFGLEFSWNTTYLDYVSHTVKVPVETYPDGVLHEPIILIMDTVNEVDGTYELAVSSLPPAPSFNGSGTIFEITFMVLYQPWHIEVPPSPNNYVSLPLHLSGVAPSEDGEVRIYAIPPSYPPYPMLKVMPETIGGVQANETFPVDVWLMGGGGYDLDPFFDVSGAEIYLNYNSTLIEATNVTIDPDGWFASFFYSSEVEDIMKEINNTAGTVRVVFNVTDGIHTPVYGRGRLVSVEFKAMSEASEWPPPSCVIGLKNPPPRPDVCGVETPVYLEGYQHPEREMCPWNNSDLRVALPHSVENATYFARFEPGVLVTIHSPEVKNYSRQALWLNVTANVPVEDWWYSINSGSNISFTPNTTINVAQCANNLVVYAGSMGMEGFSSIQFYALKGDLDGDRDVDIFDIVLFAGAYGSYLGHPDYRPEYDIDPPPFGDGDVDIFDIVSAVGDYGKSC